MGVKIAATSAALCLAVSSVHAADPGLTDLSIEELANLQITSVSRRAERLSDAAAAVYVITPEAIRRSGATSLPQALRLAPNLQVAQVNANQYAISARGFNNAIGNKLLVLVDGRTVYTPFFSGVFWDQQDLLLEDVERIEVISGPGATLWGSNAVNGVINVITRAASETQGVLAVADAGTNEGRLAARYGGTLGELGHFRLYGKRSHLSPTRNAAGTEATDRWDMQQAGFRADGSAGSDDWTLQGDIYRGISDTQFFLGLINLGRLEASGANLLGRWTHRFDGDSSLRLQAYYDRSKRDDPLAYRPQERIADVEAQHALRLDAHQLVWGGGYRRASDDVQPGLFFGFVPASRTLHWSNLFLQDGIRLGDSVDLTLGAKLEHNDYTGTEKLPSARLAWKPAPQQLLWGAVSRAVRAPARLDRDIRLPPPPRPVYIIAGGSDFVSEVATVFELGWREQLGAQFSYSLAAFHTRWSRLRSGQPPPNAQVQNMIDGSTQGIEAWADWRPVPRWRLSAGLTLLNEDLQVMPGSTDPVGPRALGNDPHHQWSLRSSFDVTPTQELDIDVRRVAALPDPQVPAYTAWNLRYGWRPRPDLLLALVGRNLFQPAHAEFGDPIPRSEIARSAMLQVTWTY
jgi:iron complex outermembrane receptor protein